MKKCGLFLLILLVCSKSVAITEYPIDFTVSSSECNLFFTIISSQNHTVSLSGDGEYDDGDMYYWPAVQVKTADFPYNLIIPQTVVDENISYDVVSIAHGAFGNGARQSTDRVSVHYFSMNYASSIYSLTLPSTIQTINSMLPNIKILKCCATTPPTLNKSIPSSCSTIYVPQSSLVNYQSADGWSDYADRMVGFNIGSNLITDISFSSKSFETNTATPIQLMPTVTPSSSASNITWSSSDTSIATVDASGTVSGVSPGECYVTATSSDGGFVFATIKITINSTPPITNITLNETEKTIYIGDFLNTVTLTPTISPSESAGVGVTWSSSNSSVASVDQNGVVTAVAKGTATITCNANDESGITASCLITVDELSSTTIGSGGSNYTFNAPFHTVNNHNEVFLEYKASEIGKAGKIQAISFEEKGKSSSVTDYVYPQNIGIEIWIGKIADTSFYNSTSPSGNEKLNQMIRVCKGTLRIGNITTETIQRTIIFDTPYEYDGSYALNIFISTSVNDVSDATRYKYLYTRSNNNSVKFRGFDESVTPSSWRWYNSDERPNIKFWFDSDIKKLLNSSDITVSSIAAVTYNGSAQTPAVTVKDGTTTLVNGIDYIVSYSNNTNAGTATVTITGMGNYGGTRTPHFTIKPKNASSLTISSIAPVTYNGLAQTPIVMVEDGNTTLTKGTDYTVSYSNNINVGTATMTITGKGNYTGTNTANFTINAKSASNLTISNIAAVTYNGSAQIPTVTIKENYLDTSYTSDGIIKVFSDNNNIDINVKYLAYEQNTCNEIMCCIVVQSPSGEEMILDSRDLFDPNRLGAYCVSQDGYTFIDLQSKEAGTWHLLLVQGNAGNWYYSLSNTMPTTNIYTLQNGTDYTVAYSNNINAGTATVTVTGKGNYTGTKTANFTINAKNASSLTISDIAAVTYNGSAQTPAVTVKDGTATLTSGTDYTIAYSNNINAGTATVTVTGKGNYTGTKTANFTINAKNVSSLTISDITAVTYNGSAQTPTVTVKDGTTTLTSGTDYTVSYSNNTNAGTATVTITGKGNYTGTKTAEFTINPKNASNLTISDIAAVTYNGSAQTPAVTVKDGTTTLTSGTDYTVAYSDNTNPGTATVTVTGKGNYTGTKTAEFTINAKNASNLTISDIAAVTYNGSAQTPAVTVKDGTTTLTSGTDYTVSYSNNTNAGTATVTVTGKGNYTGTKTANFTINKAPLTVTARSYTITQGNPLPTFECTYSGFKNGETASVLTTLPTISCSATSSSALGTYDIIVSGGSATNYAFTYVNGTLTIEAVAVNNIQFTDNTVKSICVANWDTSGDGELSEAEAAAVTDLGTVFKNNTAITSFNELQHFTGLTSIENSAFYGCSGLTSITIPNSVTSIGNNAFNECWDLTSITIGNSVTSIGNFAFCNCRGLTSIVVEEGNGNYDSRGNCNAIIETASNILLAGCKNTVIPNSVTSIGNYAFMGCSGLTSTTIPNSVTSIRDYAFYGCSGLTSITIPNSVTSIGNYAFSSCRGLTSIVVEEGNSNYDSRGNCNAIIKTASNELLAGCKNTLIPNSVTSIGNYAFSGCSGLTSITIPNSVTSIENSAFYGCSGLTSITIPNSVTSIGSGAFSSCSGLTSVVVNISSPLTIKSSTFSNRANATLYVPKDRKSAYQTANYWKEFKAIKEFPDPDVNQDGNVNVVDVVDIARFVVGTPRDLFVVFLADLNNSGEVNVADAIVLVNEIAGDTQFARQLCAPEQTGSDVLTLCSIDNTQLSLQLDGSESYAAFQFDLWLPSDMDVMQLRLNDERRQGHQLLYNKVGEDHYRVVALSTSGNAFNGTSGELLGLTFDGFATDEVRMDNIHFVTTKGTDVPFDALGVTTSGGKTVIHSTENTGNGIEPTYNLNGQRLESPRKGINIIGGKKIVVK